MPIIESDSITTTAAVSSNALAGVFGQTDSIPRVINRVALVGSAAAGDARVDFFIGTTFAGTYRNTATGNAAQENRDWIPVGIIAEEKEPLNLKLVTAPTTNAMRFFIDYDYA